MEAPGERAKLDLDCAVTLLERIGESEQHFNTIESEYRKLASQWLLAGFAGMGFVATADSLPLPAGTVMLAIALATAFGIQLLWIIDVLAYHRLLSANFLEGLRLEADFPQLPQVRWNMLESGLVERRVRLFYFVCSAAPLPFGAAVLSEEYRRCGFDVSCDPALASVLVPLLTGVWLWRHSGNDWFREQREPIEERRKARRKAWEGASAPR